jgi:hypothetical protein
MNNEINFHVLPVSEKQLFYRSTYHLLTLAYVFIPLQDGRTDIHPTTMMKLDMLAREWSQFNLTNSKDFEHIMPAHLAQCSIPEQLVKLIPMTFYEQKKAAWKRLANNFIHEHFMLICEILHEIPEKQLSQHVNNTATAKMSTESGEMFTKVKTIRYMMFIIYKVFIMDTSSIAPNMVDAREDLRTLWRIFVFQHRKYIEPHCDFPLDEITTDDTILEELGDLIRIPSRRMDLMRDMFNAQHQERMLDVAENTSNNAAIDRVIVFRELGELFIVKYMKEIKKLAKKFHSALIP